MQSNRQTKQAQQSEKRGGGQEQDLKCVAKKCGAIGLHKVEGNAWTTEHSEHLPTGETNCGNQEKELTPSFVASQYWSRPPGFGKKKEKTSIIKHVFRSHRATKPGSKANLWGGGRQRGKNRGGM